ncbi:cytochrome P450 [Mycobacterium intermedium]|uniref:cytochrome P450 n=1 Tax=Mycobacterium intermedium TaxID=28445 RepID=UPI000A7D2BFF|nr:cytochrome P450 [Mycobacterium intermedium]
METTADPVLLPPIAPVPKWLVAAGVLLARNAAVRAMGHRYGGAFAVKVPVVGTLVVVSDPQLIKDINATRSDLMMRPSTLGSALGPGSTFSLHGAPHRQRRKLLMPAINGRRVSGYESIVEEEVLRKTAHWPEGREFPTLESMRRITLNIILRAVFGADGDELEELRALLPPMVVRTSIMAALPPRLRRDVGPWSPGGQYGRYRRRYDEVIESLIAKSRQDPHSADRRDVLSLLVAARYTDGQPISNSHIADELLTLLAAGHETTATSLAWAVERLRRHPELLERLVAEVDTGGSELLQATVWEVQRTRPVIEGIERFTLKRVRLGPYVIPENTLIAVSMVLAHNSEQNYPDAERFEPDRFVGNPPDGSLWIPYGGGINRCVGAAFANMEMVVTLRTLLRHFTFAPTDAKSERNSMRSVTTSPSRGGRAVVYRRAVRSTRPDTAVTEPTSMPSESEQVGA